MHGRLFLPSSPPLPSQPRADICIICGAQVSFSVDDLPAAQNQALAVLAIEIVFVLLAVSLVGSIA